MINRLPDSFATEERARGAVRGQAGAEWPGDYRQWLGKVEQLVAENPSLCLAAAFFVGASVAWWIKRR